MREVFISVLFQKHKARKVENCVTTFSFNELKCVLILIPCGRVGSQYVITHYIRRDKGNRVFFPQKPLHVSQKKGESVWKHPKVIKIHFSSSLSHDVVVWGHKRGWVEGLHPNAFFKKSQKSFVLEDLKLKGLHP